MALMLVLVLVSSGGRGEPGSGEVWEETSSGLEPEVAVIRLGVTVKFGLLSLALTVSGDGVVGRKEGVALEGSGFEEPCSTEEEV